MLYHSEDPLELLAQIGRRTDRVFIWTHYYSDELRAMQEAQRFIAGKNVEQVREGECYLLHYRSYGLEHFKEGLPLHYEGGQQAYSLWMERTDIERMLRALGFNSIKVRDDGKSAGGVPFVSLLAERN